MTSDPPSLLDWLSERRDNCLRIANAKTGQERAGWLEDLSYFEAAIARLREIGRLTRERDEAMKQDAQLRGQVRELQEQIAVLDPAYRAVTEQLSRSATLAATAETRLAEVEKELAEADAVIFFECEDEEPRSQDELRQLDQWEQQSSKRHRSRQDKEKAE